MSTKARTKFNPEQLHELERLYRFNSKPLKEMLIELGEQVGLELRTIQIWFQNRRMKDRHSNNNNGSSVAPSPATTQELSTSHKSKQELYSVHAANRTPCTPSVNIPKPNRNNFGNMLLSGFALHSVEKDMYMNSMQRSRSFASNYQQSSHGSYYSYNDQHVYMNENSVVDPLMQNYQENVYDNNVSEALSYEYNYNQPQLDNTMNINPFLSEFETYNYQNNYFNQQDYIGYNPNNQMYNSIPNEFHQTQYPNFL